MIDDSYQEISSEEDDENEAAALTKAATKRKLLNNSSKSIIDIQPILHSFIDKYVRNDKKESLMALWEKHKYTSIGALYKIAMVVHSTPAAQVSVERLFSGLRFVSSKLRCKMTGDNINDVMIVRSN